jgi:hypothetical protein
MDKIITPNGLFEKKYSDENNNYSIKIESIKGEIQISMKDIDDKEGFSECYKAKCSREVIAGDNNILSKIDIEDIKNILINVINSNNLIIQKENQTLITFWKFIMIKEVVIKLVLKKEKLDDKQLINQLLVEMKNVKKENSDLKKEINILKKQVDSLIFQSSNIVNFEDRNRIKEWIDEVNEKNRGKEIRLIYKATRDGDSASNYHDLCDNKSPLITLIKTKKNRKFGHYTESKLVSKNKGSCSKDERAFLFSLNTMKKYKIIKPENAIWYGENFGPCFGSGCDIFLSAGFLSHENNVERNASYKTYDVPTNNEFTGESNFGVNEVEVYQIIV